jgi:hypothetical protein
VGKQYFNIVLAKAKLIVEMAVVEQPCPPDRIQITELP